MKTRSKDIGTRAETAVVRSCQTRGFGGADRLPLRGGGDTGDVGLCPGVVVQVKGGQAARSASDRVIAGWLAETAAQAWRAHADVGVLVTVRAGIGPDNAHRWWAHLMLRDLTRLAAYTAEAASPPGVAVRLTLGDLLVVLRAAGYGDPPEAEGLVLDAGAAPGAPRSRPAPLGPVEPSTGAPRASLRREGDR